MKNKKRSRVFNFFDSRGAIVRGAGESLIIFAGFVFLSVLISQFMIAATLSCNILDANNCVSPNITVFRLLNDTSGYFNAHLQNATLSSYSPIYNYSLCCSSDSALGNSCSEAVVLKLSNFTNAHAQFGTYSGPNETYSYNSCLSADPGAVSCTYSSGSCSGGYTCVASMASSEEWAANETNAHAGPCSEYDMKVCCKVNSPPEISNVVLNSTYGTNYTYENLTVYFSESDADGDSYTNITDWRKSGASIAVLNLAFNTNTSSPSLGAVRDYSTYDNDGTLGAGNSINSPVWAPLGKVGGAYQFDGVDDYIRLSQNISLGNFNWTFSTWVKTYDISGSILSNYAGGPVTNDLGILSSNISYTHYDGGWKYEYGKSNVSDGKWHFLVWVNYANKTMELYVDGVKEVGGVASNVTNNGPVNQIGKNWGSNYFNGTIDEAQIFNSSLSANQIKAIYNAGIGNRSVQTMHSDETAKGEVWTVAVTGNDKFDDGTTMLSNNLTIRGSVPNVSLLSPPDGNETRLRTPVFEWNATDADNDGMTYEINITEVKFSGQFVCDDDIYAYPGVMNFTPSSDLECFYDNNYYYLWSVRANDSDGYSEWAGPWKLNMTAVVDISMPVDFVSFGQLSLLQDDNTTDNSPPPFQLQNDGNALIDVNVTSTNLWSSVTNPNEYYRFKINNNSLELGSFSWVNSSTSWTYFPSNTTNISGIVGLRYPDAFDSAIIDLLVQVPPAEPPGNKTATVTFMSILAE
ncbi:MAG: LamG domain-containing protein [Nanoarchaeota archaeon]|nr:LamG domain-containing protein [Nanoarchaeota archaeon]